MSIKDPTAPKTRRYLLYSVFQQIIDSTIISESLLISYVIICDQSVPFFLEHKHEVARATVGWQNQ